MTSWSRAGLIVSLAFALTVVFGGVAVADQLKAVCDVSVQPSVKPETGYVISVHLKSSDGRPVNEATVRFYETVELFGAREMLIGVGTTDGQGSADLLYLPAKVGTHEIVARYPGRPDVAAASGRTTFEATVAAPPYKSETLALSPLAGVVPYGAGALVLGVWALIGFALFATARGVLRGASDRAQQTEKKGDIA